MEKAEGKLSTNNKFLHNEVRLAHLFTPEDFHDEEALIAKTAEMFVKQDVSPKIPAIEKNQHEVAPIKRC